jgi:hypothetical protein
LIPGSDVDETTSWSTVLLENLMVAQLVQQVLAYHGHETLTAANGTCPGPDEFSSVLHTSVCQDDSVGTATRYGLEGPGTDYRWVRDFPYLSGLVLWPIQPLVQWIRCLCLRDKAAGAWCCPPTPI